ncbi:MAG: hypothetical protein CMN77_17205 [Spirochaetaceae bacterium]|nr:hypothetical protein [Spirochaetaceae bacterium]|tara:strand:+ start:370 stop:1206 length:837 start_codon:yes stop_codon:yes gene_type:complete
MVNHGNNLRQQAKQRYVNAGNSAEGTFALTERSATVNELVEWASGDDKETDESEQSLHGGREFKGFQTIYLDQLEVAEAIQEKQLLQQVDLQEQIWDARRRELEYKEGQWEAKMQTIPPGIEREARGYINFASGIKDKYLDSGFIEVGYSLSFIASSHEIIYAGLSFNEEGVDFSIGHTPLLGLDMGLSFTAGLSGADHPGNMYENIIKDRTYMLGVGVHYREFLSPYGEYNTHTKTEKALGFVWGPRFSWSNLGLSVGGEVIPEIIPSVNTTIHLWY